MHGTVRNLHAQQAVENAVARLSGTCSLVEVERAAIDAVKRRCIAFNNKRPEVGPCSERGGAKWSGCLRRNGIRPRYC